jgi:hypothetical protein
LSALSAAMTSLTDCGSNTALMTRNAHINEAMDTGMASMTAQRHCNVMRAYAYMSRATLRYTHVSTP